jgi:hypothetical protein
MQLFIAELSNLIDQGKFEESWHRDGSVNRELSASLHDVALGELIRSVLRRRTDDATTKRCRTS